MLPVAFDSLPLEVREFLRELFRGDEAIAVFALSGGVSSEIWMVAQGGQRLCVKRALPQLKVSEDWQAPVERSVFEYAWFETVAAIRPDCVPRLAGRSQNGYVFAMEYLNPATHPLWKNELLAGRVNPEFASAVGESLVAIHAGTAGNPDVMRRFQTDAIFGALRIKPYLLHVSANHPEVSEPINRIAGRIAITKLALVHGDVSPKNILIGPSGPVFLDGEVAWYGDPAFDLAFCLNHLLLKHLPMSSEISALQQSFTELHAAYLKGVTWETPSDLEVRAAAYLPALTLARVDGKSPVEYIAADGAKSAVRSAVLPMIKQPRSTLEDVLEGWSEHFPAI